MKNVLFIFLIYCFSLFIISCSSSSDDGSKSTDYTTTSPWTTKQLGTSSGDYGNDVTTDSSGNIYVTGYTEED